MIDFKSLFRPGILATRPYSPGKPICEVRRELGLGDVIKLASNENPEGPLPEVLEAIAVAARDLNRYPDSSAFRLTEALAANLGVTPDELILGNGSNEVIDILIRALVSPGENVVFSQHSFIVYALTTAVHFECGRAVPLGADDRHDLPAMAAAIDANTKLVIVCNPNNPTGTYNTADEFTAFMKLVPPRVVVAVDEAYYEYVTAPDYPQTLAMREDYPNLISLRTFSKIHSLAGLRIGYGIGHVGLITELHKTREPFNVNSLSQAAAVACLQNPGAVAERARRNTVERERLARNLEAVGFQVVPSQANFLLVRCNSCPDRMKSALLLTTSLLMKGVIVRPMHAFGLGEGALRISVGLPEENDRCVAALREILS